MEKKKFYQKGWFWLVVIVLVVIGLIPGESESDADDAATEVAVDATQQVSDDDTNDTSKDTAEETGQDKNSAEGATGGGETEIAEENENANDVVVEDEDEDALHAESIADGLYDLYYPTYLVLQYDENMLLNKNKKMKLYIDGDFIVEMAQGEEKVYGIMLEEGSHTIKIKSGWFESEKIDFEVGKYEIYDLYMDNLFYLKMGYKFGDPTVLEFYGTNLPAEDEDVIDTNADVGAAAVYAFVFESYEPIGDFQEVFSIYEEKYGFEGTDMYKSLEDAGLLDE